MRALLILALAALPSGPASAQLRPFNCVGAERLETDIADLGFARGQARPRSLDGLADLVELAKAEPARNICVLGHAAAEEGGAQTAARLAAARAREVATELAKLGVERDRIRAEARTRGFAPRGPERRPGVRVVLMPEGNPS
ncbi:MAG: OmpA family protein [Acetobacteraceae bacterium]|nr:OmpA family protein [Acetobacteraceae bacterium]